MAEHSPEQVLKVLEFHASIMEKTWGKNEGRIVRKLFSGLSPATQIALWKGENPSEELLAGLAEEYAIEPMKVLEVFHRFQRWRRKWSVKTSEQT